MAVLNLFAQIPDSLASLTALRALNLSNCMIDSLHSLTRNPLPAITALNLRANRLISIAGIERLYPLERLDLRDNKLVDPTELARLTGIPDLREIWVAGNPFTKTHSNYRVTIFNLFRQSPGYTEDILIDSTGPGYNERRQLVERVAERAGVPVVKPPPTYETAPVNVNKPAIIYPEGPRDRESGVLRKERPAMTSSNSETYTSSSRKRRTPKRRIVDLSTSETSPIRPKPVVNVSPEEATASAAGSDSGYGVSPDMPSATLSTAYTPSESRTTIQPERPRIDTSRAPQSPPVEVLSPSALQLPHTDNHEWNISGEIYRKKIEALRNEVGNGWLSVLSEESWDVQKAQNAGADFSPASTIKQSPTTPRAASQPAIHSGRTLG